jgi:hypothetical protein
VFTERKKGTCNFHVKIKISCVFNVVVHTTAVYFHVVVHTTAVYFNVVADTTAVYFNMLIGPLRQYMYKDTHCYFTTAFTVSFNGPMRHLDAQTRDQS